MRSRFEEVREDEHLDEPVTITGRQLKSLQRGAKIGMVATILAVIAVGLAAFSLIRGGGSSASEAMAPTPAQAQPAPAVMDSMPTTPTQPLQSSATPAPSTTPTPAAKAPASTPPATKHAAATTHAATTTHASKHSGTSSAPAGDEPLTVPAFSPSAAPVSPAAPAPTPVAPTHSAAPDTTKH